MARDRWLSAQRLGGRPIAVQRLLGTDPEDLPPAEAARRAALLARYPELAAVLDKLVQVRTALTAALNAAALQPVAAGGKPALPGAAADWDTARSPPGWSSSSPGSPRAAMPRRSTSRRAPPRPRSAAG
jgi:anti-sigma factor RsiW